MSLMLSVVDFASHWAGHRPVMIAARVVRHTGHSTGPMIAGGPRARASKLR
jgi:hypothetical protein